MKESIKVPVITFVDDQFQFSIAAPAIISHVDQILRDKIASAAMLQQGTGDVVNMYVRRDNPACARIAVALRNMGCKVEPNALDRRQDLSIYTVPSLLLNLIRCQKKQQMVPLPVINAGRRKSDNPENTSLFAVGFSG